MNQLSNYKIIVSTILAEDLLLRSMDLSQISIGLFAAYRLTSNFRLCLDNLPPIDIIIFLAVLGRSPLINILLLFKYPRHLSLICSFIAKW